MAKVTNVNVTKLMKALEGVLGKDAANDLVASVSRESSPAIAREVAQTQSGSLLDMVLGGDETVPMEPANTPAATPAKVTPALPADDPFSRMFGAVATPEPAAPAKEKKPNPRILQSRPALNDLCNAHVSWSREGAQIRWHVRLYPGTDNKVRATFTEKFDPTQIAQFREAYNAIARTLPKSGKPSDEVRKADNMPYKLQKFWNPDK